MPLTVRAWECRLNYKAFAFFTVILFSIEALGFALSMINSVFFVIVLSVLALLPIWVASLFLFGECRQVTANVIGEAEVSTWEEVRRFWWLFAIGIGLWIAFVALTGRYYNLIQIVSFIAVMLVAKINRMKVKITDVGIVFGRMLLLRWDNAKIEFKGDYVVLRSGLRYFAIPKNEILNTAIVSLDHVLGRQDHR
jgi:hypothetical protein